MTPTIFLLDDNRDILEVTECHLESHSFKKIYSFTSPLQALQRIHLCGIPDLIITDFNLPEMTGIEFLAKVADIDSAVNAIVITAHPRCLPDHCRYPVVVKEPDMFDHLIPLMESILRSD
jgi:two-component SAPR family response regulator